MKNSKEIMTKLMDSLNKEDTEICLKNRVPYILTKACFYLNLGSDKYREGDAFNLPSESWSKSDLEEIESGCKQILLGKGFRKDHPFKNLSIRGFYLLFELFHFKSNNQKATKMNSGNAG